MWRLAALFLALSCAITAVAAADDGSAPGLSLRERNFLNEAALLNLTEMHASKLAEDMAETDAVRGLASRLGETHATAHQRLRAIAAKHGLTLPPDLDRPTRDQLGDMQTYTGPAFDRFFLAFQEETHLRALKLFDAQVAEDGDEGLHHYAEALRDQLDQQLRTVEALTTRLAREQPQSQGPQELQDPAQQSAEQPERTR